MKYVVIVEPTETGFSAYAPDVPGCVASAPTRAAVEDEMRHALALHLEGLRADGLPVPEPVALVAYVDVAA